jgi:hypothetical protein
MGAAHDPTLQSRGFQDRRLTGIDLAWRRIESQCSAL